MARSGFTRSGLYLLMLSACLLAALRPIIRHVLRSPSSGARSSGGSRASGISRATTQQHFISHSRLSESAAGVSPPLPQSHEHAAPFDQRQAAPLAGNGTRGVSPALGEPRSPRRHSLPPQSAAVAIPGVATAVGEPRRGSLLEAGGDSLGSAPGTVKAGEPEIGDSDAIERGSKGGFLYGSNEELQGRTVRDREGGDRTLPLSATLPSTPGITVMTEKGFSGRGKCVGGGESFRSTSASLAEAARHLNRHVAFPGSSVCGPWADSYAALHRRLISGKHPFPTFLVFRGAGGLGDRFTGLVTSFLLALTSSRAFIIQDDLLPLAFDPAEIDWAYDFPKSIPLKPPLINPNEDVPFELIEFMKTDAADEPAVVVNSNRGMLLQLFQEHPEFAAQVLKTDMGMHPDTTHGCILRFLLRPKHEALEPIKNAVAKIIQSNGKTLGVHLRIEDRLAWDVDERGRIVQSEPDTETLQRYRRYTRCAEHVSISESMAPSSNLKARRGGLESGTEAKWLFLSNFEPLVAKAEEEFCGRVIRDPNSPRHVLYTKDMDDRRKVMLNTVSAWILLSLCDWFLISDSGFSRTSVAYSLKKRVIYEVRDSDGNCSFVEFASLAKRWSGL